MDSKKDFQEILVTYNSSDIAIIKSALDAAEINYFIKGEHVSYLFPLLEPSRLMVDVAQAQEAIDILRELGISERSEP